MMRVAYI